MIMILADLPQLVMWLNFFFVMIGAKDLVPCYFDDLVPVKNTDG